MSTGITIEKYVDLGNPVVKILISNTPITNTLIELGETINMMKLEILNQLRLYNLLSTPTVFELVDQYKHNPEGILEDVIVSLDS